MSLEDLRLRLKKLQALEERTAQAILGEDWEVQIQLRKLRENIRAEIRDVVAQIKELKANA